MKESSAPSKTLLLLEARALWELGAFLAARPALACAPRGDGHGVLVLPGLGGSELSTRPLRGFLRRPRLPHPRLEARPQPRPAAGDDGLPAAAAAHPEKAVRRAGQSDRLEPGRPLCARARQARARRRAAGHHARQPLRRPAPRVEQLAAVPVAERRPRRAAAAL